MQNLLRSAYMHRLLAGFALGAVALFAFQPVIV